MINENHSWVPSLVNVLPQSGDLRVTEISRQPREPMLASFKDLDPVYLNRRYNILLGETFLRRGGKQQILDLFNNGKPFDVQTAKEAIRIFNRVMLDVLTDSLKGFDSPWNNYRFGYLTAVATLIFGCNNISTSILGGKWKSDEDCTMHVDDSGAIFFVFKDSEESVNERVLKDILGQIRSNGGSFNSIMVEEVDDKRRRFYSLTPTYMDTITGLMFERSGAKFMLDVELLADGARMDQIIGRRARGREAFFHGDNVTLDVTIGHVDIKVIEPEIYLKNILEQIGL